MKPADVIKILEALPQDKSILCQVVDEKGNAFQCEFEFIDIPQSDWLIQLRVSHPQLKDLYDIQRN